MTEALELKVNPGFREMADDDLRKVDGGAIPLLAIGIIAVIVVFLVIGVVNGYNEAKR